MFQDAETSISARGKDYRLITDNIRMSRDVILAEIEDLSRREGYFGREEQLTERLEHMDHMLMVLDTIETNPEDMILPTGAVTEAMTQNGNKIRALVIWDNPLDGPLTEVMVFDPEPDGVEADLRGIDRSSLNVIGVGLLPDGFSALSYKFFCTHIHSISFDRLMIVKADESYFHITQNEDGKLQCQHHSYEAPGLDPALLPMLQGTLNDDPDAPLSDYQP